MIINYDETTTPNSFTTKPIGYNRNLLNHYNHDCYDKKTLCIDLTKEFELDQDFTYQDSNYGYKPLTSNKLNQINNNNNNNNNNGLVSSKLNVLFNKYNDCIQQPASTATITTTNTNLNAATNTVNNTTNSASSSFLNFKNDLSHYFYNKSSVDKAKKLCLEAMKNNNQKLSNSFQTSNTNFTYIYIFIT